MKIDILHSVYKVSVILFIIVIGVSLQAQVFGEELSTAQNTIWKMEEKYWSSWKKEGVRSIQAFHDEKAIIWASNGTFTTDRTNLRSYFDGIGDMVDSFDLEINAIRVFDNFAVTQYYAMIISLEKPITLRISHTWMKQDGKWVIIGAVHGSCSKLPGCL